MEARRALRVVHLLSGLSIGGKERVALQLASCGLRGGERHSLTLYDEPFRPGTSDFDPGAVPWQYLPRKKGFDVPFALRLGWLLCAERADVIHAHNETGIVYAALALALVRKTRAKLVGTYHTWPPRMTRRGQFVARWAASRGTTVAVSQDLSDRLVCGGWLSRCDVIPNGVDIGAFSPNPSIANAPRRHPLSEGRVVVNVARYDPIKGQDDLIAAAEIVHREMPKAVFVIAGDGPARASLEAAAERHPYVRIVGPVRNVAALLRAADLFVLPSHDEGTPMALLEAMATGCPSVATDVGGVRAILEWKGPSAGTLVPARNPDALAEAILGILRAPSRATAMGQSARVRAEAFGADAQWVRYSAIYHERCTTSRAPMVRSGLSTHAEGGFARNWRMRRNS